MIKPWKRHPKYGLLKLQNQLKSKTVTSPLSFLINVTPNIKTIAK